MIKTSDKILVVGGAGYVGSVLVGELLQRGYAVKIFDRLYFGDKGLIPYLERVEFVLGDIRRPPSNLMENVSAVINVAGLSNDPTAEFNPQANYEMNTLATESLARLCIQAGVRRYLFASSCSIYDVGVEESSRDVIYDEDSVVKPKAAYALSKYDAERRLLDLASADFSPVILRKGTVCGYSPRLRFDLVVNTFVKDALSRGFLNLHFGGEMWRPLVDIRDVARAYVACLAADPALVSGHIFNVVYANLRISELALRVQSALRQTGVTAEIQTDYRYFGVRSYRVSGEKIGRTLGWRPAVSIEESTKDLVEQVRKEGCTDFSNPRYYNISWLKLLEEARQIIDLTGYLLTEPPSRSLAAVNVAPAGKVASA